MIPKVIHYCWFGRKPLPDLALKCIASWKVFFPDYEIKEWNEDNFDVGIIPYTQQAYNANKYAFVSDYARFWILYHFGGLYFDTDVELIKNMDDIVEKGAFMGCENEAREGAIIGVTTGYSLGVNPGLGLGVSPGHALLKELLDLYENLSFIKDDGSIIDGNVVTYTTELLTKHGLSNTNEIQKVADIWVYPKEYFCPKNYYTNELNITKNSRSIHHYSASWISGWKRFRLQVKHILGPKFSNNVHKIKRILGLPTVEF